MRNIAITCILITAFAVTVNAQTERKSIRKGNRAFGSNDYIESEIQYRKALESNTHSFKGKFNLADALYKQDKFDESIKENDDINISGLSDAQKAMIYHNKGNAYYKLKKYKESADAYKKALKLNPNDQETKYNLSEALRMLKQQQQQQQQNKNNDKNNKDNKNKDNQDKKNDQNKDKDKQNQQDKKNDQNDKSQQQQNQQPQISKEDAERMLEAIQNNEKEIQEKMKQEKAKAAKVRVIKNW